MPPLTKAIRYWTPCQCSERLSQQHDKIYAAIPQVQAGQRGRGALRADLRKIARFQLLNFDRSQVRNPEANVDYAERWLNAIEQTASAQSFHHGPPCALYIYSPGRGRGKTHIAAAIANEATKRGKLADFVDEIGFFDTWSGASLDDKSEMMLRPSQASWLTVIDDVGQRRNVPPSLQDFYYNLINPRWLAMRWTIFTSNHTPQELLTKNTLSEASYGRLMQMIRKTVRLVDADDYRRTH